MRMHVRQPARPEQHRSRPAPADHAAAMSQLRSRRSPRSTMNERQHRGSTPAPTSSWGTRSRRRRAIDDSTTPTSDGEAEHAGRERGAVEPAARPMRTGTAIPTTSAPSSHSLSAAPSSMRARSGPPWSSTITSWIIVSSRCVLGSSTGMRAFSARNTTTRSAAPTSASAAASTCQTAGETAPSIAESESRPRQARERGERRAAAPARRAPRTAPRGWRPSPRSAEPVSSAASTVKKRAERRAGRRAAGSRPGTRPAPARRPSGTSASAASVAASADERAGAEDPGRRPAVHRALAQQLGQVEVELQQRRAAAPGEERLRRG